jgi:hypothetical protein
MVYSVMHVNKKICLCTSLIGSDLYTCWMQQKNVQPGNLNVNHLFIPWMQQKNVQVVFVRLMCIALFPDSCDSASESTRARSRSLKGTIFSVLLKGLRRK